MLGAEVYGSYQKVKKLDEQDIQVVTELEGVGASRRRVASALSDKTGDIAVCVQTCSLLICFLYLSVFPLSPFHGFSP